jgi:thymidylate synthase
MRQWHQILRKVLQQGEPRNDRTGTGTLAVFGEMLEFDNSETFPAVTTKRLAFKQVAAELACFIQGYDNLEDFHKMGCTIWDANALAAGWVNKTDLFPGDLGRIYGVQWCCWSALDECGEPTETDQLKNLVSGLMENPTSRRHVVTAYNPGELDQVCLPPCHTMFQCYVSNDGRLDLSVTMRSADLFLGLPFDVASYAILQRLLALKTGYKSGRLVFFLGDAHIYKNHLEQVEEVLSRIPFEAPGIRFAAGTDLFAFHPDMAGLVNYQHRGAVAAPMSV